MNIVDCVNNEAVSKVIKCLVAQLEFLPGLKMVARIAQCIQQQQQQSGTTTVVATSGSAINFSLIHTTLELGNVLQK
jgi:hypothetical protein